MGYGVPLRMCICLSYIHCQPNECVFLHFITFASAFVPLDCLIRFENSSMAHAMVQIQPNNINKIDETAFRKLKKSLKMLCFIDIILIYYCCCCDKIVNINNRMAERIAIFLVF